MRNYILLVVALSCAFATASSETRAQETPDAEASAAAPAAKTKIEAFVARDGVVIVKGFGKESVVRGSYGSSVEVQPREFVEASTGKRLYGITITVKEAGRFEREHTSYIDLDEVDSLLRGLEYISKVDASVTKLDNFEATYSTRGDLKFTTFSSPQGLAAAVTSGTVGRANAYLDMANFATLRLEIAGAKRRLDSIR